MKYFLIPLENILPAALALGLLSGCHSPTDSVEASTTKYPVAVPAGTVLRVRLKQALDTENNRPGDRFSGVLEAAVSCAGVEILQKGTVVEGHVLGGQEPDPLKGRAVLALTLDSYERNGQKLALETNSIRRISDGHRRRNWTLTDGGSDGEASVGSAGTLTGAGSGASARPIANGRKRVFLPPETILGFTLKSTLGA